MAHAPVFNKQKPKPAWLTRPYVGKSKLGYYGWRYYRHLWDAQPGWANPHTLRTFYRAAARLRREGVDVEVDHVVPLRNPLVCGLHAPANLRIIRRRDNARRSNRHWPDMPYEQLDMFACCYAHVDFELQRG